jgi:hypothetical protein
VTENTRLNRSAQIRAGRAVSVGAFRPPDPDELLDEDAAPDDPAAALGWYRNFKPPAVDPDVLPVSAAFPRHVKDGVKALGRETGCKVVAFTATAALHRGADWLLLQPEIDPIEQARGTVERSGWSTSPLEWPYTLRGCGAKDKIELRCVGRLHSGRVHRLKDALGLSLRSTAGLCILFGIVDLKCLKGAIGRQASEQAREFLTELEQRIVLAQELARRARNDPAPVTSTARDELRRHR